MLARRTSTLLAIGCGTFLIVLGAAYVRSLPPAKVTKIGAPLLDGFTPENIVRNGVFQSYSWDFDAELAEMQQVMGLKPGMTYCEMGAANGLFMKEMAKLVMPGGKAYGTAPDPNEVAAFVKNTTEAGIPENSVFGTLATNEPPVLGLPPNTCDWIYSRMVYHMIPEATAKEYVTQLAAALKPGGKIFFTDHDSNNGKYERDGALMPYGMGVVPIATEIREFQAGGLYLERVIASWPYFGDGGAKFPGSLDELGYGLIWSLP